MTPEEEITVGEQWNVVRTMKELNDLEDSIKRFISHTMQTMSTPVQYETPFGPTTDMDGRVEHPLGRVLSVIRSCQKGCYETYGKDMFEQGVLFEKEFADRMGNG